MSVKETAAGKHVATFRGPDGRERQKTFTNRKAAREMERDGRSDAGRGIDPEPRGGQVTGEEWARVWMAAQAHLSPSTLERYAGIVRTHILPTWGPRRLNRITHAEVQAWVSELTSSMAPASVRKTHRVLSLMLDLAVRDSRLRTNVATGVNLPRVVRARHRYLTHQQLAALVEGLDDRQGLLVSVLAYCGLRWGELAALRVSSVDFLRRRLVVERSVSDVNGALVWRQTTKSHQHRSVPFPRFLAAPLAAQVTGRGPSDLLFGSRAGTALRVKNFRRDCFDAAAADAGLEGLHPHELRHTAASLAVSAGANVKAVQNMLGHANASMTLDEYADLFPDDMDSVAEALDTARRESLADFSRTSGASVAIHSGA